MDNIIFNNSKITKICYHGTDSAPFTVLDKTKIQKDPEEGDAGYFGWGFYLTTSLEYAQTFGKNILKFKVNIQNPFDFNDADYDKLVEFIFSDSDKKLNNHIHDTMYFLRQVGNNKELEYKNNNSEELKRRCLDVYHKYKNNKSFTDEEKQEIASLLAILAKDLNNWLNGLFFYFGREIFHYFTSNGFDGIIALDGKEVVVYETKQLEPVQEEELHIVEDIDDDETPQQNYKLTFCRPTQFSDGWWGYNLPRSSIFVYKYEIDNFDEFMLHYSHIFGADTADVYGEIKDYFKANKRAKAVIVKFTKRRHPKVKEDVATTPKSLTKAQVLKDLINTFGIVDLDNLSDAVYILPDGRALDTRGDNNLSQHENISKYLEDKYHIKDASEDSGSKFMNSIGAIRVTPWLLAITVPSIKMTEKQDDALFSVIKHLSTKVNAEKPLMISSEDGRQYIQYNKVENPEEVITAILGYQILGILKEKLAPGKEHKFLNKLK